ncbi:nickel-dependent hydrogenase large subunit [Devriesea agamarum]|uniref:nickel-dependent hydrogenase large subunit n=1 Tax=Devriesea agamarum TaxID=472569 RepID=UPI00071D3A52|nr:nickel-dependent hydrogenase large subunit [Devriesea agamarum]
MGTIELNVSPLGRVEGDLDVSVTVTDGVVTDAWTHAVMFRGFETILRGKDPQAGLIMTPRICGICGGSHLYKAAYALDTAWRTHVPHNATLVRNIAQACETLQSIPRYFYALFAIDLTHEKYASSPLYEEACRRFSVYTGTSYQKGVVLSGKPVEVYAILGGQWPHSSFMIPGGIMGAPTLSDITRSTAILKNWKDAWLEGEFLGCSVERWLENRSWDDVLAWLDEKQEHAESDLGFFIRYCLDIGLDSYGQGVGNYLSMGSFFDPEAYQHPTIDSRQGAVSTRGGIYLDSQFHEFDQANVTEDVAYSHYKGGDGVHPFDGTQDAIDPEIGKKDGKYSFAKAPRYTVPGHRKTPFETGPLARRIMAGQKRTAAYHDEDPLFLDVLKVKGPSVFTRQFARLHEAPLYYTKVMDWLAALDLHGSFHTPCEDPGSGKGWGATEAARGALADWIVLEDGKIANYNVITPGAWNMGPRDEHGARGPVEEALVGSPVHNLEDPVELGHVARSFDSCLVCTVHTYDGKTGREMSKFVINEMV